MAHVTLLPAARRALLVAACLAVTAGTATPLRAAADADAAAAQPDTTLLNILHHGYQGAVNFVTSKDGGPIKLAPSKPGRPAALVFLDQYGVLFNISNPDTQLVLDRVELDPIGQSHATYHQIHKGVNVFSGVIKVHHNANGDVLGANGRFYPIKPTLQVVPSITAQAAEQIARKEVLNAPRAIIESNDLVIVDPGWYGDPTRGERLAYQITITDLEVAGGVRESMFIDAHTGKVLDRWSLIEALLTREVHDGAGAPTLPGAIVRAEGQPATGNADIDKAYDYAADLYRYLQRGFGRDSINNAGLTLVMTPNSTAPSCPNAYWNGFEAVFCAGVVTDDVVCHELTHGLTGYTAGLIYQNQSGQLNESMSDVFGEICDLFNGNVSAIGAPGGTPWPTPGATGPGTDTPNNARSICSPRPGYPDGVRWLVAEDASAFGGAIRDMWDPTCRNSPDRANSPLETCNPNDAGGVHSGSGVPNHAFALTTDGGTFNGHTITGIGLTKAGAVWYRALTVYLTPSSDFKDAYDAFTTAAANLVGTSPNDPRTGLPGALFTASDAAQVTEAMLATEMNTDGTCGQTDNVLDESPPAECASAAIIFSDDFEGATFNWAVANSAPPTPYNWVRTTAPLPYSRPGHAVFCEDRPVGDCNTVDESATHTLTSPAIAVPAGAGGAHPYLAFTHTIGAEGTFDGGTLELSVNNGPFNPIPRTAIEFNPYNGQLVAASLGNTDPLAGRDAWTGFGGKWGRTIVDLSSLGVTGNSIRLRFTFGKDGCTGSAGWYVDDVVVYNCPDCDNNGQADIRQFRFRQSSPTLSPIGFGEDRTFSIPAAPAAADSVTIELLSKADLSLTTENIGVSLNGVSQGNVFVLGGIDCSGTPQRGALSITAADWNAARAIGIPPNNIDILLTGSADMNAAACNGSFVGVSVRYNPVAPADANTNLVPDSCEVTCPSISAQPQPVTVTAGQSAMFSVTAAGSSLNYAWQRNGSPIANGPTGTGSTYSGAATPSLTIANTTTADSGGSFRVVVSNSCGPLTSTAAFLTVNPPPCPGDFNHSGAISVQDIFDFLAAYFANNLAADFNHSGAVSVQDIFDYLAAYFAGC